MRVIVIAAAVLIALASVPVLAGGVILDTGNPIYSEVTCYVSDVSSIAVPVVVDQDYRVESASVDLAGRGFFAMLVSETQSSDVLPDHGLIVSQGSFQRPDYWDWRDAWCSVDLQDFTMKKGVTYWFEYTNPYPETSRLWVGVPLFPSQSYTRACWNGSAWYWPSGYYSFPDYVPGMRLYGYAVPEPSSSLAFAAGLVCLPLLPAFRSRKR